MRAAIRDLRHGLSLFASTSFMAESLVERIAVGNSKDNTYSLSRRKPDRHYWREIIAQLKTLRATGKLISEGSAV